MTYDGKAKVVVTKRAAKSLLKVPRRVAVGFIFWKKEVETHGIERVRRIPGYHDEPLKGKLRGVRSVRLGRGYRAYYRVKNGEVLALIVEEVNKHDYKAIEKILVK